MAALGTVRRLGWPPLSLAVANELFLAATLIGATPPQPHGPGTTRWHQCISEISSSSEFEATDLVPPVALVWLANLSLNLCPNPVVAAVFIWVDGQQTTT